MQHLPQQSMTVDSTRILEDLTTRQFVRPHDSLHVTLAGSAEALGFCIQAANHAAKWLEISPDLKIGRLRRTELMQLSRSIHRFWRHAAAFQASAATE